MPEGRITAYDPDAAQGRVTPTEGGDDLTFKRSDVVDRRTGEKLRSDQRVTFEIEEERATDIRRVTPRGYGA